MKIRELAKFVMIRCVHTVTSDSVRNGQSKGCHCMTLDDMGSAIAELEEVRDDVVVFLALHDKDAVQIPFLIDGHNTAFEIQLHALEKLARTRSVTPMSKAPYLSAIVESITDDEALDSASRLAYVNSMPHRCWVSTPRNLRSSPSLYREAMSAYRQWLVHGFKLDPTVVLNQFSGSSKSRSVMRRKGATTLSDGSLPKQSTLRTEPDMDRPSDEVAVPFDEIQRTPKTVTQTQDPLVGFTNNLRSRGALKLLGHWVNASKTQWEFTVLWNCYQTTQSFEFMPYKFCETTLRSSSSTITATCTCAIFSNLARRAGSSGE